MPLYTYRCPIDGCTYEDEFLAKYENRDLPPAQCPMHHDTQLIRKGVELPQAPDLAGIRSGNYQVKAIMGSGEKVAGRFGKTARRGK